MGDMSCLLKVFLCFHWSVKENKFSSKCDSSRGYRSWYVLWDHPATIPEGVSFFFFFLIGKRMVVHSQSKQWQMATFSLPKPKCWVPIRFVVKGGVANHYTHWTCQEPRPVDSCDLSNGLHIWHFIKGFRYTWTPNSADTVLGHLGGGLIQGKKHCIICMLLLAKWLTRENQLTIVVEWI